MHLKKILVLLILAAILTGCGPRDSGTETTAATESTTALAAAETSAPTEPEELVPGPLNKLNYHPSDYRPQICPLDERTVAFLTVETDREDYSIKRTRVQLWDLYYDMLLTESVLEGTLSPMEHGCSGGYMALTDEEEMILVLDREMNQVLRLSCADTSGALSGDLTTYYYLYGDTLHAMDTSSGETIPVELDVALAQIQGIDTQENILLATVYTDPYTTAVCLGAIDLDTGNLVLLMNDLTGGQIARDGVCMENYDEAGMCADVIYLDWEEGVLRSLPGFLPNDGNYNTWHIPGSDYVCKVKFAPDMKDEAVACDIYRMGQTLTVSRLPDALKINELALLPDGNLLALEVNRRGYQPYLICPEMLTYTDAEAPEEVTAALVDESIAENYRNQQELPLDETLSNARQMADTLEDQFGVTILLSNQCTLPLSGCSVPIATTDQAQLPDEPASIEAALTELEDVLELYPEDFFRQFQNEAGERGLLILLVEEISLDRSTIGLTYEMGQWYPIAVDITSGYVTSVAAHEIWHATENKINAEDSGLLSDEIWNPCNPEGYEYSYDDGPGYIFDVDYTFFYEQRYTNMYFVDAYGKTNPHEDRARIMEYIMTSELAGNIAEVPALRVKLQIMSDAIRQVFNTENWSGIHWERFF